MAKTYRKFEDARETRRETLSLVEGLTQVQSEFRPEPDQWSVGELLDHLLKADAVVHREIEVAIAQRERGMPFVYRGLADVDPSLPWILQPVLPFFEVPLGVTSSLVPPPLKRWLAGDRRLRARAPKLLEPRFGRPIDTLRRELADAYDDFEKQQEEHSEIDLSYLYYFNSVVGLRSLPGLYAFISGHEKRHQDQLREILDAESFPAAA